MTMLASLWLVFFTFFKIGLLGFGGGYAMLSMIMTEGQKLGISLAQLAGLNAMAVVVPGPIASNAATYVGYLHSGFCGAAAGTLGVSLPSILLVTLVMRFIDKYKGNRLMEGVLKGVKPAAVGLIAAAALMIASGVLVRDGRGMSSFFSDPLGTISPLMLLIFGATAVANIRFKVNPILLTVMAGIVGAIFA